MSKKKATLTARVNGGDEVTFTPEALENLAKYADADESPLTHALASKIDDATNKVKDLQSLMTERDKIEAAWHNKKDEAKELKKIRDKLDEAIREHIRDLDKPPQPTLFDAAEVRDGE